MLENSFKETIQKYNLLKRKDKLLLGVSGGPDSICMLYQFLKIQQEYKLYLICAHFNHSLRPEADAEEDFVRNACKNLGVKFVSAKKDVKAFGGDSLEQAARILRFDFFLSCARQEKIKKLALAHHKDDVIETTLMRIIRGGGLRGLRGILPKTKFKGIEVIRPLIELRKNEILAWLNNRGIEYRIDQSNFQDKFFRNRIRLKVLPILEELNPNIVNSLFNLSRLISLDYEFIYKFSQEKYNQLKKQEGKNYIKLELEGLKKLDLAILLNVLRLAIENLKGDLRKLEFRHFEEIIDLIYKRPSLSIVDLPFLEIKKEAGWLIIKSLLF